MWLSLMRVSDTFRGEKFAAKSLFTPLYHSIYTANTTRERRCKLHDVLYGSFDENELDIIFVECVCTDKQVCRRVP